ncbi:hypothetical protein MAR_013156 [Mya arenaria]|uniref:Ribosomal protein S14 n=1 Tax=Mya arenaria TaxID=6604 RepID=A0ABY7G0N4_MYAAR|nr:hypothetical protein MAR_013156 [Mya arenaria]
MQQAREKQRLDRLQKQKYHFDIVVCWRSEKVASRKKLRKLYITKQSTKLMRRQPSWLPTRFLLQCLSEIEALNGNSLVCLSWTPELSTDVFRIERNKAIQEGIQTSRTFV